MTKRYGRATVVDGLDLDIAHGEVFALTRALSPAVVLMDLRMPGSGVTVTARITAEEPASRVLVLTTYGTDDQILAAVEAGATGCLLKHADLGELLQAIRGAARGETVLAPSVAARLTRRLRTPRSSALSTRETEVLRLVARGLTNAAIGSALFISEASARRRSRPICCASSASWRWTTARRR